MIDLGIADDWFTITNRGRAAAFARGRVPSEVNCPRELIDREVRIDGRGYRVKGVEHFAVPCTGCDHAFSVLVTPLDESEGTSL